MALTSIGHWEKIDFDKVKRRDRDRIGGKKLACEPVFV